MVVKVMEANLNMEVLYISLKSIGSLQGEWKIRVKMAD